jgi:hypothetical protein
MWTTGYIDSGGKTTFLGSRRKEREKDCEATADFIVVNGIRTRALSGILAALICKLHCVPL